MTTKLIDFAYREDKVAKDYTIFNLAQQFSEYAKGIATTIISEVTYNVIYNALWTTAHLVVKISVPVDQKTYKPIDVGGMAGMFVV